MKNADNEKRALLTKLGLLLFAGLVFSASGCGRSDKPDSKEREFMVRGAIRGISPDRSTLDIEHEAIPHYMPAMTMPFSVKDPASIRELKVGDAISFRMVVTDKEAFIDRLETVEANLLRLPIPGPATKPTAPVSARLRPGDMMPPFQLTNEKSETISAETFRGRPFIITFIFTRCPIPNFCPLMNKNFGELQNAIKGGSGLIAGTRLLSISFDPEFDTPAVLKETAEREKADPAIWNFATGAQPQIKELTSLFSVHIQPEAGTISHGLATALIDADGRVVEIWRGNGWKAEEIVQAIQGRPNS